MFVSSLEIIVWKHGDRLKKKRMQKKKKKKKKKKNK